MSCRVYKFFFADFLQREISGLHDRTYRTKTLHTSSCNWWYKHGIHGTRMSKADTIRRGRMHIYWSDPCASYAAGMLVLSRTNEKKLCLLSRYRVIPRRLILASKPISLEIDKEWPWLPFRNVTRSIRNDQVKLTSCHHKLDARSCYRFPWDCWVYVLSAIPRAIETQTLATLTYDA
jgi:hypothetical protein